MKLVKISWALQLKHYYTANFFVCFKYALIDKLLLLILPNYRVPSMVPY